jgi:hypothetical protein
VNPAELLGLWDICDGVVVTTRGGLFRVAEVFGHNPTSMTGDSWGTVADGLYAGLRRVDDGVSVQAFYCRGRLSDAALQRLAGDQGADLGLTDVLAYQRAKRSQFLRDRNLRDWRTYLAWGSTEGFSTSEFSDPRAAHARQLEKLGAIDRQLEAALQRAGLGVRKLGDAEIVALFQAWIGPAEGQHRRIERDQPLVDDEALQKDPRLAPLSIREQLIPGNVKWDEGFVKIDSTYFKVLAARQLPPATSLGLFDRPRTADGGVALVELGFDFRLAVHLAFPDQAATQRTFRQRRKFAFSMSKRGTGNVTDAKADVAEVDFEVLAVELAQGEKLAKVGLQAVVWADSLEELEHRTARLRDALGKLDFEVYEESWAHDRELFKSLPGMSATGFDRWRLVKVPVAGDLLPVGTVTRGDAAPALVLEDAETHQPFGWNLRQRKRPNDNFLILGASGAGKSVFVNMLLSQGVLSGPSKGRVLAIDYAGPTKSSFKVAAEVFGGKYIGISGDGEKINPWPKPADALTGGKLRPAVQAYLVKLTKLLLHQDGNGPEVALSSAFIQAAVQKLYERWTPIEAPIYSDFLETLVALDANDREDRHRLEDLIKLTKTMLSGPEAKLLNHRTTAAVDGDFLVYDLDGMRSYEDRVKCAVALVVTTQVRNTAFDGRPDRYKYIFFEEAANLLALGMKDTVEELLTTARAHGTSVCVITQEYDAYRRSGIGGVVALNTTTSVFMSHSEANAAIKPIVEDFQLNEAEARALSGLRAVRGQYSELLFRTSVDDPAAPAGVKHITTKTRLYLSPFDYQVVTSDAKDRAEQLKYRQAYPELPLPKVLEYLAYQRVSAR